MAYDEESGNDDSVRESAGIEDETYEDTEEEEEAQRQRRFTNMLLGMRHGAFAEVLGDKLEELVRRLREEANNRGKAAATFNLKLSFICDDAGQLTVKPDFSIKEPKTVNGDSIFWSSPDGSVHSNDPRQMSMDLRRIARGGGAARKVNAPTNQAKRVDAPSQKAKKL